MRSLKLNAPEVIAESVPSSTETSFDQSRPDDFTQSMVTNSADTNLASAPTRMTEVPQCGRIDEVAGMVAIWPVQNFPSSHAQPY